MTDWKPPRHVLPVIVIAQFACTSLWFAGNAVVDGLVQSLEVGPRYVAHLTSAVQLGFITGTLTFALLTIADRFSPSRVFFWSALAGALANCGVLMPANTEITILGWRFLTGFFLAGIYPVGMKIAADYHQRGLGKALGYLVGALVIGTALPHGLRTFTGQIAWQPVMWGTSVLAVIGGLLILLAVGDGPFRKKANRPDLGAFFRVFRIRDFRSAAFGYFGHMWELYSFWAFVPVLLASYMQLRPGVAFNIPAWSFAVIGIGGLSCIAGGYVALKRGSATVAFWALLASGLCCLLVPFSFGLPPILFLAFLLIWGIVVIADSPQFSTLVAGTAPSEHIGTALTIVNCVGFAITIFSMQLLGHLQEAFGTRSIYVVLVVGPLFGLSALFSLYRKRRRSAT
ncbi:MAG: MFS transporter [Saprospiraceae bacterium]|nr:MFS transporter [Saprospiraceae bacterium]